MTTKYSFSIANCPKKKTDQSYDPSENRIQFENSGEDSWETSRDKSKENSYDDEWGKVSDNHSS